MWRYPQLRGARAQRKYQLDIKEATAAYEQQRERTEAARTALANHEASAVAARRNLSVEAGTIKNSADSILYSGSDMTLNAKDTSKNCKENNAREEKIMLHVFT